MVVGELADEGGEYSIKIFFKVLNIKIDFSLVGLFVLILVILGNFYHSSGNCTFQL